MQAILGRSYDTVVHTLSAVEVLVRYPEKPGISMSKPLKVQISLKNRGPQPLVGVLRLQLPDGFSCDTPDPQPFRIDGKSQAFLGVYNDHGGGAI